MSGAPNPFRDAGPWGRWVIGGFALTGIVTAVDGFNKPDEWSVQKGSGGNQATTVWKGTKLAEDNSIELALTNEAMFDNYVEAAAVLRPKIGTKPPSLIIENPIANFAGVTRISCKDVLPPKWVKGGGYWTGKIEVLEYNPSKPAAAGPAGPAKNGDPNENGTGTRIDPQEETAADLADQIALEQAK